MTAKIRHDAVRLGVFLAVCLLGVFGLFAVFGQLRFGRSDQHLQGRVHQRDRAGETATSSASPVSRSARSRRSAIQPDTTALVEFTADDSVVLTEGSRAVIRYDDLIGGRYLALEEGAGGTDELKAGDTIPLGPHLAGAGSRRADRWFPPAVLGRWIPSRSMRCRAS